MAVAGAASAQRLGDARVAASAPLPLDRHRVFHESDAAALQHRIEREFGARLEHLDETGDMRARAHRYAMTQSDICFCGYGASLRIRFPDDGRIRIQVRHKQGRGTTLSRGAVVAITPSQACISQGEVETDYRDGFEQFVWRIPRERLEQKLATLTGRPFRGGINFGASLDLTTPAGQNLQRLLGCLVHAVDALDGPAASVVTGELEQAFTTAFLAGTAHNARHLLEEHAATVAPWQVRRAESHIEAHWDQPISIEDLVAVTGASARSLFRTFQQSRGCSPLDFARRLRLENARRLLAEAEPGTTVTGVALACGFGDSARFSNDFVRAFGERPSALLNRSRAAAHCRGPSEGG